MKDLRHSWLAIFENEINFALSINKAKKLISNPYLKGGTFKKSLLWWEYSSEYLQNPRY